VIDTSRNPIATRWFDDFFREASFVAQAVTRDQAPIAREAYKDGRASGRPAQLNFGDCFACALAKAVSESILFKGRDFIRTDLTSAMESSNCPIRVTFACFAHMKE